MFIFAHFFYLKNSKATLIFLHILSSYVIVRLYTENQICSLLGSASKVCVVMDGWWVVENKSSD